jgi:para-aminobenzoate synthetase/4-amino-4-deoxychorismate lyase
VNYTYRLHFHAYGSPIALYSRLRQRQPVPYGALICLPEGDAVLSLSPELFIRHQGGRLLARPMKGTAAATGNDLEDQRLAASLANDSKNRAENLMIVDLLRNDLGRIAETGSVTVPQLFQVQRFSSVLQMTSTIEANLCQQAGLAEIMSALFPCGSITGAPKRHTMEIIRQLESEPRGIYTGAIGWFDVPSTGHSVGDFCLSVPIRTLHLQAQDQQGIRQGVMGVGAGIVHDSVASEEYAECQLKAKFLTRLPAQFDLFETLHASHEGGCRHLSRHLHRLGQSARYFGFEYDEDHIRQTLWTFCDELPPQAAFRLRLTLQFDGQILLQSGPLLTLPDTVKLLVATHACNSDVIFLQHKTSVRQQYDDAWREAERHGAFDMVFCNPQGFLTEGGRSNIFIRQGERWFTPPLSDGVLPGIMRAILLEDPQLQAREKQLTLADLNMADAIILCNSLRGAMNAKILTY